MPVAALYAHTGTVVGNTHSVYTTGIYQHYQTNNLTTHRHLGHQLASPHHQHSLPPLQPPQQKQHHTLCHHNHNHNLNITSDVSSMPHVMPHTVIHHHMVQHMAVQHMVSTPSNHNQGHPLVCQSHFSPQRMTRCCAHIVLTNQ